MVVINVGASLYKQVNLMEWRVAAVGRSRGLVSRIELQTKVHTKVRNFREDPCYMYKGHLLLSLLLLLLKVKCKCKMLTSIDRGDFVILK